MIFIAVYLFTIMPLCFEFPIDNSNPWHIYSQTSSKARGRKLPCACNFKSAQHLFRNSPKPQADFYSKAFLTLEKKKTTDLKICYVPLFHEWLLWGTNEFSSGFKIAYNLFEKVAKKEWLGHLEDALVGSKRRKKNTLKKNESSDEFERNVLAPFHNFLPSLTCFVHCPTFLHFFKHKTITKTETENKGIVMVIINDNWPGRRNLKVAWMEEYIQQLLVLSLQN